MKVAFVGSFSTGKTTLANLFAREWDYPLLPEVAREVVELGFPLDQSATAETETLIFLRQWRAEQEHERFVADRSIYDVIAYADWVMEHQPERKENHLWHASREIAFPIVLDGLRPDDTAFQADIDRRLKALLDGHAIDYQTVTGSIEDRQAQVRKLTARI